METEMGKAATGQDAEATAAAAPAPVPVPLDQPIVRGETKILRVDVRRPLAGELTGLSMRDIMDLDAVTMRRLLPRITMPTLTELELRLMDPADFFALSVEASGFFLPKSVRPASPAL